MERVTRALSRAACLISLLAPIVAVIAYPRANWLFAFPLVGIGFLLIVKLMEKDPLPSDVAERAELILSGTSGPWDVDDYEHLNPKEPKLRDLWNSTMSIHLPEEWIRLDEENKAKLRKLISEIREFSSGRD